MEGYGSSPPPGLDTQPTPFDRKWALGSRRGTIHGMPALSRPIVLVGLMGCGKTTVGSRLADRLGRPFWDGDAKLLEVTGMAPAALAAERGLDVLHGLELEVMSLGLAHRPPPVVAAAAAVGLDPRLPALLLEAWTVWLRVELTHLVSRLQRDDGHRPLLGGDLLATLREMERVRDTRYAQVADLTLDTTRTPPAALVQRIVEAMPAGL
jgi:shikimate kinase